MESGDAAMSDYRPMVASWLVELQGCGVGVMPGVVIENKEHSLSVHYRASQSRRDAEQAIYEAARGLAGARLVGGKCVLNIIPSGTPHKGTALLSACQTAGCDRALFVGDDVTDEDVFALADAEHVLGIRVGRSRESHASFYVRHRGEVDRLLTHLLALPNG